MRLNISVLVATHFAFLATSVLSSPTYTSGRALRAIRDVTLIERTDCLAEMCFDENGEYLVRRALNEAGDGDSSMEKRVVGGATKKRVNLERTAPDAKPALRKRKTYNADNAIEKRRLYPRASILPPTTFTGTIQVNGPAGAVGFVSKSSLNGAQLRYQDVTNALIVTFTLPGGATSGSGINVTPTNGDITSQPLLGVIQGRDDADANFAAGSYQYGYLANTAATAPGAPPSNVGNSYSTVTGLQRVSMSAGWNIDVVSGAMTFSWINTDGSIPNTVTFVQSTAIYFGGDSAAFLARYPSPVTAITFTFIPI